MLVDVDDFAEIMARLAQLRGMLEADVRLTRYKMEDAEDCPEMVAYWADVLRKDNEDIDAVKWLCMRLNKAEMEGATE